MRALRVVVVNEPSQPAVNAGRTAVPRRIEVVHPLFERLEQPFKVTDKRTTLPVAIVRRQTAH